MFINTNFVYLTLECFLLASNYQLILQSQAANRRLLDESPPSDNGHNKVGVGGSQPRHDGSWTGNNSPSGSILQPPPTSATKFAYASRNVTANGPSSSVHTTTSVKVKTVSPSNDQLPSVIIAMPPSTSGPGFTRTSTSITIKSPSVGSPGGSTRP